MRWPHKNVSEPPGRGAASPRRKCRPPKLVPLVSRILMDQHGSGLPPIQAKMDHITVKFPTNSAPIRQGEVCRVLPSSRRQGSRNHQPQAPPCGCASTEPEPRSLQPAHTPRQHPRKGVSPRIVQVQAWGRPNEPTAVTTTIVRLSCSDFTRDGGFRFPAGSCLHPLLPERPGAARLRRDVCRSFEGICEGG